MSGSPPPRPRWIDWAPFISLALIVAGIIFTSGGIRGEVQEHTRRLQSLESLVDRRDEQLRAIDVRLARMEAKLEIIAMRRPGDER